MSPLTEPPPTVQNTLKSRIGGGAWNPCVNVQAGSSLKTAVKSQFPVPCGRPVKEKGLEVPKGALMTTCCPSQAVIVSVPVAGGSL